MSSPLPFVHILLEQAGMRFFILSAQLHHLVEADEDRVVIVPQPLGSQ